MTCKFYEAFLGLSGIVLRSETGTGFVSLEPPFGAKLNMMGSRPHSSN